MSTKSTIEWTNMTWNPTVGCSIISPGCHNCYAMRMAARLKGSAIKKKERGETLGRIGLYIDAVGEKGRWNGHMALADDALEDPFHWKKPQRVFVNSMSDLFHENLPLEDTRKVCQVMAQADWHTYQVLTKRADRLHDFLSGPLHEFSKLPHIWWGVSVENKQHGLPRMELLKKTPAQVRFLSIEPLLEDLGPLDFSGIHWAIVGGESGSRYRPLQVEWVRSLRDQCVEQKVPFFLNSSEPEIKNRREDCWMAAPGMKCLKPRQTRFRVPRKFLKE